MALGSTALIRIRSTLLAMKFSICPTCVFRSYLVDRAVTLTFGLIFLAASSVPLPMATKKGLAISPTVRPTAFSSLAEAGAMASRESDASTAGMIRFMNDPPD